MGKPIADPVINLAVVRPREVDLGGDDCGASRKQRHGAESRRELTGSLPTSEMPNQTTAAIVATHLLWYINRRDLRVMYGPRLGPARERGGSFCMPPTLASSSRSWCGSWLARRLAEAGAGNFAAGAAG
jgi:hypothetical protein